MKSLIKSIIRKGSVVLLFYVLFSSTHVVAQEGTNTQFNGKKAIAIGIGEMGYSINYTTFYKENKAYEVKIGYRQGENFTNFVGFSFKDPFWCYNQFVLQGGLRFYNSEGLYFSTMIAATYGFYDNLQFPEYEGRKSYYPLISREKKGIGGVAKFGFTPIKKRFVMDIYLGLGFKVSQTNEKIVDPDRQNNISYSNYWKIEPTVHVGFLVGILLK